MRHVIITTPLNAARTQSILSRAIQSGLNIRLVEVDFPFAEVELPEGCENVDLVNSLDQAPEFFSAANKVLTPVKELFEELKRRPSCIISDVCLYYTAKIARKFHVPRISFAGVGCFTHSCIYNVAVSNILGSGISDSEYFVVPNLPDKVEFTKSQVPLIMHSGMMDFGIQVGEAELDTYGTIVNSFEELKPEYVIGFRKSRSKTWSIGPVSLCNKDLSDKSQRELGLGLQESRKPFVWVIRGGDKSNELEKWIEKTGFEDRNKEKGLIIRGWAPQLLILSHPGIRGFLTHCGWNATLEGISTGLPMVTWPLFADQFINEKLVVEILKIGVRVGVEKPVNWGLEEKTGVLVKKEDIKKVVEGLINEGSERKERRKIAEELGEMAKRAVEEGGSSYRNITLFIQDIMEQAKKNIETALAPARAGVDEAEARMSALQL